MSLRLASGVLNMYKALAARYSMCNASSGPGITAYKRCGRDSSSFARRWGVRAAASGGGGVTRSSSSKSGGAGGPSSSSTDDAMQQHQQSQREWEEITSAANPLVKHLVKLRERAKYRRETRRALLVGATVVRELAECGAPLDVAALLLQPGAPWPLPAGLRARRVARVTPAVARKISGVEALPADAPIVELDLGLSGGVGGAASLRDAFGLPRAVVANVGGSADASAAPTASTAAAAVAAKGVGSEDGGSAPRALRRLLALEAVQDPGNMGTLLRCAAAFGWDAVALLPGCCDPFNDKALRAARGAALRLPLAEVGWPELAALAADAGLDLLAAEPEEEEEEQQQQQRKKKGKAAEHGAASGGGVCLVLGTEGQGLSREALRRCQRVAVPMAGGMESLNVSVAGGILMFMLSEGQSALARRLSAHLPEEGGGATAQNER